MKSLHVLFVIATIIAVAMMGCGRDGDQVQNLSNSISGPQSQGAPKIPVWGTPQTSGGKGVKSTDWDNTVNLCGTVFINAGNCENRPFWDGDVGIPNVTVTLHGNNLDLTTVTSSNGSYCFMELPLPPPEGNEYTICVVPSTIPPGLGSIYPHYGNGVSDCQIGLVLGSTGGLDFGVCGPTPPPPGPCVAVTGINAGFNGTAITGTGTNPGYLWFNSNFSVSGMTEGKHVTLTNSVVTINGTPYNVPDADITFTNGVPCAVTTFAGGKWVTTIPVAGSDEIFLSGLVVPLPNGLPGGAAVNWTGTISTDQPGVCLNWKWSAASYKPWPLTGGSPDYNAAMIKAAHSTCAYNNGNHAGTPQNPSVKASVTGGARGGGGSNWTGSWSSTLKVCPICPP